jgi:iron complex outermembrane receptor protein
MSFRFIALPLITLPFITSQAIAASNYELDSMVVTASRLGNISSLPASISIITAEDIKRSPANTLPELLSEHVGVSTNSLFSHGSSATVGLRSFGETATQNTLILLDGRRLNDIDLSSVNYAAIAIDNIERIEITRGSGGVLYGDGATTGTINIITKDPRDSDNYALVSQTLGSFDHRETNAFFSYANDSFAITGNINSLKDDGYRDNNQFRQDTGQFDLRIPLANAAELYIKAGAYEQDSELPGERVFNPSANIDELSSNRTGTTNPNDWADEYTEFATVGFSANLNPHDSFIVDAGYRRKRQRAMFFDYDGFNGDAYAETALQTLSLTPRLTLNRALGQHAINWIIGADLYLYQYDSNRSNFKQNIDQPAHTLAADQKSFALYSQATIALSNNTDLTAGIRGQRTRIKARDNFDATAPGSASGSEAADFNESDRKTSFELGLKHAFTSELSAYSRFGRSTRFGTIDELFESVYDPISFTSQQVFSQLKPQVSDDIELGLNYQDRGFEASIAIFHQSIENEIHFDANTFLNVNLDDTQHDGIELAIAFDINSDLSIKANYTYLKAEFTDGDNKANDIPLIPTNTANIVALASLPANIDGSISFNYVDTTLLANDLNNSFAKKIPAYKTVDLKLSKQIGNVGLALQVNNLFNEQYFNYAVGSTFTAGKFNAYPLPERTAYLTASYKFD